MNDEGTTTGVAEQTFTTPEVCRLVGVSFRQLDYWSRVGHVDPAVSAKGSGTHRVFTLEQVAEIRLIARLHELGLPLTRARDVVEQVRGTVDRVVVVTADTVEVVDRAEAVDRIAAGDGAAFLVVPERFVEPV